MTYEMGEQLTLQDLDTLSMKTYRERPQATTARTSGASSRRLHKSAKKTFIFLDARGGGHTAEALSWTTEALPGEYTMHNTSEFRSGEKESACWLTSTDLLHQGFCLTLNLSERPRVANPTLLSDILEEEADPRYNLSSKACRGILNRANKRGKKLPEVLEEALRNQIDDEEAS